MCAALPTPEQIEAQLRLYRLGMPFLQAIDRYFYARVDGLEHLPEGPALLVGNHNGGMVSADSYIFTGAFYRHTGYREPLYFLGHQGVIHNPLTGPPLRRFGAVLASPDNARRLLSRHKVMVYPGGDWEALRPWRDRDRIDFGGRAGFVRTALEAGVPIVPIVAAGAHDTFRVLARGHRLARLLRLDKAFRLKAAPIAVGLPWGLMVGPITPHIPLRVPIRVRVMPPVRLSGDATDEALQAGYDQITRSMQATLTELAADLPGR